jgi:hypothetical protein
MLTLYQLKALNVGASVNLTPYGSTISSSCTVIHNGPPLDGNGNAVPNFPDTLTLQIGSGPMTINWGYGGLNDGLSELSLP